MHLTEIIVLNRMSMKTHVMTDFGRRGGIYSNVIPSAVTNFLDVTPKIVSPQTAKHIREMYMTLKHMSVFLIYSAPKVEQ